MWRWIFELLLRWRWFCRQLARGFIESGRDRGSARKLIGAVPFVVFEATPSGQVRPLPRALDEAFRFLRREALRYGRAVSFHSLTDRPLPLTYPGRRPRGRRLKTLVAQRLRGMRWLAEEAAFALVLVDVPGEAWAKAELAHPLGCIEYCVCSRGAPAHTLAHEILHLFGARDFYPGSGEPAWLLDRLRHELGKVTDLTHSIMACPGRVSEVEVDRATAFAVGWADVVGSAQP